jgi:phage tail-like protein
MAKRPGPVRRADRMKATMALLRNRPYGNYNFLVDFGGGNGGFSEVIIPGIVIDVIEYRNGNDPDNAVRKLPGMNKAPDVTLKRGLVGALDLYEWINDVRNGNANAVRDVVIQLQSEDRTTPVWSWRLRRAWPSRYSFGALNAKGKDLAIEEMALTYERLDIE